MCWWLVGAKAVVLLVDGGAKQKCDGDMGDKGGCGGGYGDKRLVCLWLWGAQKLVCGSYGGPKTSVLDVCKGCAESFP